MNICVTAQNNNLESQVDPRFGRCNCFIIVDTETMKFEAINNPSISATGGAGVQAGQLMASKQVKAVLSGNIGPNAFQSLQQAGIDIISGVSGNVREAIERYKKGEFKPTQGPSANSKFGMS
ncbi:MAG: NifB/NifX family molybdenum-iron cluster-binding protein [Bacteroidetes bacterium]|nr:NifB/NifX family molybdenum-iron cluster-binding protein [Bacteroidota bacterium]